MMQFLTVVLYVFFNIANYYFDNFLTFFLLNIFEEHYGKITQLLLQSIKHYRSVHFIFLRLQLAFSICDAINIQGKPLFIPLHFHANQKAVSIPIKRLLALSLELLCQLIMPYITFNCYRLLCSCVLHHCYITRIIRIQLNIISAFQLSQLHLQLINYPHPYQLSNPEQHNKTIASFFFNTHTTTFSLKSESKL